MLIHYKALSLCAAVAATALFSAAPAQAQTEPVIVTAPRASDMPRWWVSYRDLNLTFAPHRVTLMRRVRYAVNMVCQERDMRAGRSLTEYSHYITCRNYAWNGARPQVVAAINQAWARAGWRSG